jgi:epoxide hydrolase
VPSIEPFPISVPEQEIAELRSRLAHARWPESETVTGWSQGVPSEQLRRLTEYWRTVYDWRRCEQWLNEAGQFRTEVDGIAIHFMHLRSPEPGATPMIMTHGWPGSVLEFVKVVGPLTNPVAHGGDASDAVHLVLPSLPGYGFSGKPDAPGWGVTRIARAWLALMQRLGYNDFVAQGGDWGAAVTSVLGAMAPPQLRGVHLNMPLGFPPELPAEADLSPFEAVAVERRREHERWGRGYSILQATRPQTVGYALTDSPTGQAAWIFEKFHAWSDCGGDPFSVFTEDELLDNISLYWFTATAASSARLYWESSRIFGTAGPIVTAPAALTVFPHDIARPSRRWAERVHHDIRYWSEAQAGGHFAALEQPEIFIREIRSGLRALR